MGNDRRRKTIPPGLVSHFRGSDPLADQPVSSAPKTAPPVAITLSSNGKLVRCRLTHMCDIRQNYSVYKEIEKKADTCHPPMTCRPFLLDPFARASLRFRWAADYQPRSLVGQERPRLPQADRLHPEQ